MDKLGLFELMPLFGPLGVMLPMLLWILVIGPVVLYPVARWKAHREGVGDPHLGLKVAVHYFRSIALQTVLLGVATLLWTILMRGNDKGALYRAAFGMIVPGGIVYAIHHVVLRRTNDESVAGVKRVFLGYNVLTTGLVGFTAFVLACQALFAKGSSGDAGRLVYAATLVYGTAWGWLGLQLVRLMLGPSGPPSSLPYIPAPPATPMAPAPTTPGLPPLSPGAFPPIENR